MHRRTRAAFAAAVAFLVVLTTTVAFAAAVGTSGVIGKFEIDGNQAFDHLAGATWDWENQPTRVTIYDPPDPNASGADTHFGGGGKEEDTNTWSLSSQGGPLPNKDDLTRAYVASDISGDSYLWLGFERVNSSGNGNAHVNFELNQSGATRTNSNGAVVPIRTNGDLLVTYDYGGSSIALEIRQWSGNQSSGTWNLITNMPAGSFLSTINGAAITRPASLGGGTVNAFSFGEVGLDLTQIIPGFSLCPGFSTFNVKSRTSGNSFDSSLADLIGPAQIVTCPHPTSTLTKGVRDVTANVSTFASSINASPGDTLEYQVAYQNTGNAAASGITVTDQVQADQTYVDSSCAGADSCSFDPTTHTITWHLAGPIAGGAAATDLTFRVTLDPTFPAGTTVIHNVANGTATGESAYHSNTTDVTVAAAPASQLTKGVREHSTAPDGAYSTGLTASPGDELDYRVVYQNNGNAAASNISVSDTLQPHQTLVSGSCSPSCTVNGSTLSWTIAGPVNPGAANAVTLTFSVTLDSVFPAGTTDVTNQASGTSTQEPNGFTSNQTDVQVGAGPNSQVVKSVRVNGTGDYMSSVTASPGDTLNYKLVYTNTGNAAASNVNISDTLTAHQTLVDGSCSPSCTVSGSTLSWHFDSVQPGAANAVTMTFSTTLDSVFPAGTTDVQNAAVCTTDQEPNCNSNTTHTTVPAAPASQLVKGVRNHSTDPTGAFGLTADASPGDTIDYQIVYSNTGDAPASGVTVQDALTAYQTLVPSSCSPTCTVNGSTLSWSLGTVQPGAANAVTITFSVTLDSVFPAGTTHVSNVAVGSSDQEQHFESPPTDVTVTAAPISMLTKGVRDHTTNPTGDFTNGTNASPGDVLDYQIVYENTGNAPATNIAVGDAIQPRQTYVDGSCAGGTTCSYDSQTKTVSWTIAGPVNPGVANEVTLTFQVTLDAVFPAGTTDVFNQASGTSDQEQQSFVSNQTDVQVGAGPISTLTKGVRDHTTNANGDYATSITAAPGDTLDYRVLYENDGNAPASNITVTDVVQAHQTYVANSCTGGDSCAYNDATKTITWSIAGPVNPNPGNPIALTLQVTLDATFPAGTTLVHNQANGTATGETFTSNETTVTVSATTNLGAVKSASTTDAVPGDQITYTIAYFNSGNADATNVTITENVPTGTVFVSCDQSCSGSPNGPITWTIASVPGNTSAAHPAGSVHLTVLVTAQAACQILNTATIASNDQNNGLAVNSNTVTVNVHLGGPNTESSRAYGASVFV